MGNRSSIYGVGVNDSDYPVRIHEKIDGKFKIVWDCSIFTTWKDMMKRCYSKSYQQKRPTYKGCSVCEEWLSFMNFHAWAKDKIGYDPSGKKLSLDKDILFEGNKVYSPTTCVFISNNLNNFISKDETTSRSGYKGVGFRGGKYLVWCTDPLKVHSSYVGSYTCPEEASYRFVERKIKYLDDLLVAGFIEKWLYDVVLLSIEKYSGKYT